MAIACICGSFGKPAAEHENDCPVRRVWDQQENLGPAESARCEFCGLEGDHASNCITRLRQVTPLTAEQLGCDCGIGSTKPAYRHDRGCAVYRAWVEKDRPLVVPSTPGIGDGVALRSMEHPGWTVCPSCGEPEGHADGCKAASRFTVGQAVRTPAGSRGRVISVDAKGAWPVVALIEDGADGESPRQFNEHGWCRECAQYGPERNKEHDVLPAPRRAVVWVRARFGEGGLSFLDVSDVGPAKNTDLGWCSIRVELVEGRFDE